MSRVRGTEKAAAAAAAVNSAAAAVNSGGGSCADAGHGTFTPFFLVQEPVYRRSSAFDPKTEDLRGTCKKSTNVEVSRSPYFLRFSGEKRSLNFEKYGGFQGGNSRWVSSVKGADWHIAMEKLGGSKLPGSRLLPTCLITYQSSM